MEKTTKTIGNEDYDEIDVSYSPEEERTQIASHCHTVRIKIDRRTLNVTNTQLTGSEILWLVKKRPDTWCLFLRLRPRLYEEGWT